MFFIISRYFRRNFYKNVIHTLFFYTVLFLSFCLCMDVSNLTSDLDLGVGLYWGTFVVTSIIIVDLIYHNNEDLSDLQYLYYNFENFNFIVLLYNITNWLGTQFCLSTLCPLFLSFVGIDLSISIYLKIVLLMLVCSTYIHVVGSMIVSTTIGLANKSGALGTISLVPLYLPIFIFGNDYLKSILIYDYIRLDVIFYITIIIISLFLVLLNIISSFIKSSW